MAVSQHTQSNFQSSPYVLPVDINLLMKVNNYKQASFYKNAQKLQSSISTLSSYNLGNEQKNNYLRNRVDRLDSAIGQVGSVDYSDINVTNALDSAITDVANDPLIMEGIIATKQIQQYEENLRKMKSDPKLMKFYDPVDEAWTRENFIKNYTQGGLSATYSGPTAPTPYAGNPVDSLAENIKKLNPNIVVRQLDDGTKSFFDLQTNKELEPYRIEALLSQSIDAKMAEQLRKNSWYQYTYQTGNTFTKNDAIDVYTSTLNNKAYRYDEQLRNLNQKLKEATTEAEKNSLLNDIAFVQGNINSNNEQLLSRQKRMSDLWDRDSDTAKYNLYYEQLVDASALAFSYKQESRNIQRNYEKEFQNRKELELMRRGFMIDNTGTLVPLPENMNGRNSKNNKGSGAEDETPSPFIEGSSVVGSTYGTDAEYKKAFTVNDVTIAEENNNLQKQRSDNAYKAIETYALDNNLADILGFKSTVNTTGGGPANTYQSDLLVGIAGTNNRFEKSDLEEVLKNIKSNGSVVKDGKTLILTQSQRNALTKINDMWNRWADEGYLPEGVKESSMGQFSKFAEQDKQLEMLIDANKEYVNRVNAQVFDGITTVSQADKDWYLNEYSVQRDANTNWYNNVYMVGKANSTTNKIPYPSLTEADQKRAAAIEKKGLSKDKIAERKKEAYETASKALNYKIYTLPSDPKQHPPHLANLITQASGSKVLPKDFNPVGIGKSFKEGEYVVEYTYPKDGVNQRGYVTISESNFLSLIPQGSNFKLPSNPTLEKYFRYGRNVVETKELTTKSSNFNRPVKYKIIKYGENEFKPAIKIDGRWSVINALNTFRSPSSAEDAIKNLTNNAEFKTYDSFENYLKTSDLLK